MLGAAVEDPDSECGLAEVAEGVTARERYRVLEKAVCAAVADGGSSLPDLDQQRKLHRGHRVSSAWPPVGCRRAPAPSALSGLCLLWPRRCSAGTTEPLRLHPNGQNRCQKALTHVSVLCVIHLPQTWWLFVIFCKGCRYVMT